PASACRGLAWLEAHLLAGVPDTLAVVGVGRAQRPDVGGDLSDRLLVDAADADLGRLRSFDLDALGRLDDHGVREAEAELEVGALHLAAEADAVDLEVPDVTVGDAGDRVSQ